MMQQLPPVWKKREDGYWEKEAQTDEEKLMFALKMLRENPPKEMTPRKPRPRGLYATKGFTGDEYAYVYRSGLAFGKAKVANRVSKGSGDSSAAPKSAAGPEMDWRWIIEAKKAGFTGKQLSIAMQQLSPVMKKREDGFWEKAAETDEEKLVRALEMLRENPPKEAIPREPRPRGLYATKGFTGDQYAYVYRSGLAGKAKDDHSASDSLATAAERRAAATAAWRQQQQSKNAVDTADMDPSWIAEAEKAGFTGAQLSVAMKQVPPVWKKREDGYWEQEAKPDEERLVLALEMLRENPPKELTPRKPRARGLYATKGFTGDQYAYVYRSGLANLELSATATVEGAIGRYWPRVSDGAAIALADQARDGNSNEDPKSAVAGVVVPAESTELKPEKTEQPADLGAGI